MRWLTRIRAGWQGGFTLIEVLLSLTLFATIGTALAIAFSSGIGSTIQANGKTTAINLARSQLEDVKAQPYVEPPIYPTLVPPEGYTIALSGTALTPGLLQLITVTVSTPEETLLEASAYKVNMLLPVLTSTPAPTPAPTPTPTPVPTVLAWDDFESGDFHGGAGWLDDRWFDEGDANAVGGGGPYQGHRHLRLRGEHDDQQAGFVKRSLDLSGRAGVRLRFWAKVTSFEGGDLAEARVSPDDVNWFPVKVWTAADSDDTYHFYDIDLSPYPMTSQFWIAFEAEMGSTNDVLYVDDLKIVGH